MRHLRWLVALPLVLLLITAPAWARNTLSLSVTPKPARACSSFAVAWSGTFESPARVALTLTNAKTGADVYWSATQAVAAGRDGATHAVPVGLSWPATNTNPGAAYKLTASVNGVVAAQESFPILQPASNALPMAGWLETSVAEDTTLAGVLPGTDGDGDTLAFRLVAGPAHGTVTVDEATGAFSFVPEPNWWGTTSFTYGVADCTGESLGQVILAVLPVNDAPVAEAGAAATDEDRPVLGTLAASDVDGDALSFALVEGSPDGAVTLDGTTGVYVFVPRADWYGTTTFRFAAFDGIAYSAPATVTLVVRPVNDPPVAANMAAEGQEDTPLVGRLTATDVDSVALTYALQDAPEHGRLAVAADGTYTFEPDPDWFGYTSFTYTVSDGEFVAAGSVAVTVLAVNDAPVAFAVRVTGAESTVVVGGVAAYDVDGDALTYETYLPAPYGTVTWLAAGDFEFAPAGGWHGETTFWYRAFDGFLYSEPASVTVNVLPGGGTITLPPDPSTVAPELNRTAITTFLDQVAFLFESENPIQRDADPRVFAESRVAVVRGRVVTREGQALPGVRVKLWGHSEYGYTLSRADGAFDLAVNGGGRMILDLSSPGYVPAQRQVNVPWNDFVSLDDVALVPFDSRVTAIALPASTTQEAISNPVTDGEGTRTARLFFLPGTRAYLQYADGTSQPAATLHVRLTEVTVGPRGPQAMPAELPPSTAYTYAISYDADEAIATDAVGVKFSRPVAAYVDNFYGFPVGAAMPIGYYDRFKNAWVAEENGVVLAVLSVAGGRAQIDATGDGVADDLPTLTTMGFRRRARPGGPVARARQDVLAVDARPLHHRLEPLLRLGYLGPGVRRQAAQATRAAGGRARRAHLRRRLHHLQREPGLR